MEIWQIFVTLLSFYYPYQHPLLLLCRPLGQLYFDFFLQQQHCQYNLTVRSTLITNTLSKNSTTAYAMKVLKFGINMMLQPFCIQTIGKLV